MNSIGNLFSGIRDFYRDLNPSTLTGAVDVVVVEDVATGRLTCSPFHVRFGKLQMLRATEKRVDVEVNGVVVEGVQMKIGNAGETFFVLPVDGPVPSDYQTSPLPEKIEGAEAPPDIMLTSPTKGAAEPLSDSEVADERRMERRRRQMDSAKGALSDSEIESGAGPLLGTGAEGEDEWTWKWGDLPERGDSKPPSDTGALLAHVPYNPEKAASASRLEAAASPVSSADAVDAIAAKLSAPGTPPKHKNASLEDLRTPKERTETDLLESMLLDESLSSMLSEEKSVQLSNHLAQRDVIQAMHGRLLDIVSEGVEEVELALFHLDRTQIVRTADLHRLRGVQEALRAVSWEEYEKNPEFFAASSVVCVYGPSTKCALFKTRGALQMLVGLRLYKRLFSVERLLAMSDLEEPPKPAESILSWRQWWSSPKSQSTKIVAPQVTGTPSQGGPAGGPPAAAAQPAPPAAGSAGIKPLPVAPVASVAAQPGTVNYSKSLRLPTAELRKLNLHYGMNTISFSVSTSKNGKATCTARIFLWRSDEKIVISDIDGTITKSDALGHLFHFVGRDWTHLGVANLYAEIGRNGYRFLFLTSRPIGQATQTRGYLRGIEQAGDQLPEGPVIMSPDRFFMAMRREVIECNPEQFKIPCLMDIRRLFYAGNSRVELGNPMELSEDERALPCPFYAGFGNRETDAVSYQAVGINPSRIYIINTDGHLKLQIITGYRSSYVKLVDLVDKVFPPLNSAIERNILEAAKLQRETGIVDMPEQPVLAVETAVDTEEYNDFYFWKQAQGFPQPDAVQAHLLLSNHALDYATVAGMATVEEAKRGLKTGDELVGSLPESPMLYADEGMSDRDDRYYFEGNEEAGLIPFA